MTNIDSTNIRIWYAFNALDISDIKTYDDLQRLEIGTHLSKYYSYFVYNSDSLVTEWKKEHPTAQSIPNRLGIKGKNSDHWSGYSYSEYFKDLLSESFTEYCRMPWPLNNSNCQYTEKIPMQNWYLHQDTIQILGHWCQKATCVFRGRDYTAWFSTDIPFNNGPWKFGGLPGLILKVYDKECLFVFECVRIEYKKNKFPIKIYNDYNRYRKRKRSEVMKLVKEIDENYFKIAGLRLISGKIPSQKPHFFMELE